jgi:hypothetical protein
MKPLFLQTSSNNPHYQGMVSDHKERHLAYCEKWGYDYLEDTTHIKTGWDIMEIIRKHMILGRCSHIFWIDADTFVADFSRDMRETLPSWAFMAATIHPYPWGANQPVYHINTGIMYFKCNSMAIAFLHTLLSNRDKFSDNQVGINWLLIGGTESNIWQSGFKMLNCEWNNNYHDQPQRPIVSAHHGHLDPENRRKLMQEVALRYPF